jgi:hypothetical protein
MTDATPIHVLTGLLRGAGAEAVLVPERVAPSTVYDLQYRLVVNAYAFEQHAKLYLSGPRRVQSAKQKLVQFVAMRPWLVSVVRDWSKTQHVPQLSMAVSQRLRRGFLGDEMHESVVAFLVAAGALRHDGAHLSAGDNSHILGDWVTAAIDAELFVAERAAIDALGDIKITNAMLEGW